MRALDPWPLDPWPPERALAEARSPAELVVARRDLAADPLEGRLADEATEPPSAEVELVVRQAIDL